MNLQILVYNDIHPGKLKKPFESVLRQLEEGNFSSAEVKKMTGTDLYRAKIDYENRVIFKAGRYKDQYCLFVLEIIFKHEYHKSRFLRGCEIYEEKLVPLNSVNDIPETDTTNISYLNSRYRHFHLLDKILSFDDDQDMILSLPLPQVIIGSAGSGKTVLTLEKIKSLSGKILYVTLSAYLAENSARIFYSNNYENDHLDINFLSFEEFIGTIKMPEESRMDFKNFEPWFARHRQSSKLKDAYRVFEEFRGVITGLDVTKEYLTREEYLSLGVKQSIFLADERVRVYALFEKYLEYLKEKGYYDINILSYRYLTLCVPEYDYIVIDEVQDFTNIQLKLILKSLVKPGNFILSGDSNQVVHPNFFSWAHLKSMFYQNEIKGSEIKILHANYRNSVAVSEIANRLLKIKNARFGSIDRESNYLVKTISDLPGEVRFIEDRDQNAALLGKKTGRSINYAVLVLHNENKPTARSVFNTPLLFSVQESKGLEYENIILYNLVSENREEYNTISEGVLPSHLETEELVYSRNKDKTDKSAEIYKFFINALYVSLTRAVRSVYIIEKNRNHPLIRLLGITESSNDQVVREEVSSADDWKKEARRLEKQGKQEQADEIVRNILRTVKPDWEPIDAERYRKIKSDALDPANFNKKAKDLLFDMALIHNQPFIMEKLTELKYKRAENYETERGSLFRRHYRYYREDNQKMIAPLVNKYGVNYRDLYNFTPLHAAVFSGAVNTVEMLLENGADPELVDTFNKTPLQTAFLQAFIHPDYAGKKLGKIYPLLLSDSLKILVDQKLIKIDPHKIEFFLINLFIAIQTVVLQNKHFYLAMGINMEDILEKIEHFSGAVLPEYRKRREYLLALLAKHEVQSNNPYNKQIFKRVERGHYTLNPNLKIWSDGRWMTTDEIFANYDISIKEIKNYKMEKHVKEMEEWTRKFEQEKQKRERNGYFY